MPQQLRTERHHRSVYGTALYDDWIARRNVETGDLMQNEPAGKKKLAIKKRISNIVP